MSIIGNTPGVAPPVPQAPPAAPASPRADAAAGPATAAQTLARPLTGLPSDPATAAGVTRAQGELAQRAAGIDGGQAPAPNKTVFKEPLPLGDYQPPGALAEAVQDGSLNLNAITPEMISAMSPQERRQFLDWLGQNERSLQVETEGVPGTMTNLDTALLMNIFEQDPSGRTAAQMLAARPEMVPQGNHPDDKRLMDAVVANMDTLIREGVAQDPDGVFSQRQINGLSQISELYLRHNRDNPDAYKQLSEQVVRGLGAAEASPDTMGAVLGATLVGLARSDTRNQNSFTQAALTDLFGLFPGARMLANVLAQGGRTILEGGGGPRAAGRALGQILDDWQREVNRGDLTPQQRDDLKAGLDRALEPYQTDN